MLNSSIEYLWRKINTENEDRFHFFNSFFFRKLADLDKNPSSASGGWEAFQRVCRWTKNVNLFKKDYIFIPVNFSFHWSLIIICHPGEVANIKDEEIERLSNVPCILHLDSINGSHRGLKNLILSYLCEEWKARHTELDANVRQQILNLQFIQLELPQQENSFDCGLFLLHYVECFLEQAPISFNPCLKSKHSKFLSKDWFLPSVVARKRAYIKKLIYTIAEGDSLESLSAACEEQTVPKSPVEDGSNIRLSFPKMMYNSVENKDSNFIWNQDNEITQFAGNPWEREPLFLESKSLCCDLEDGMRSSCSKDYQQSGSNKLFGHFKSVMSPIEEGEESRDRSVCSLKYDGVEHINVVKATESPGNMKSTNSCKSDGYELITSSELFTDEKSLSKLRMGKDCSSSQLLITKLEENVNNESISVSSNVNVVVDSEEENEASRSFAALVVEDSEEENDLKDVNHTESSHCQKSGIHSSSTEEVNSKGTSCPRTCHSRPLIKIELQQLKKRPRVSSSMDEDLH